MASNDTNNPVLGSPSTLPPSWQRRRRRHFRRGQSSAAAGSIQSSNPPHDASATPRNLANVQRDNINPFANYSGTRNVGSLSPLRAPEGFPEVTQEELECSETLASLSNSIVSYGNKGDTDDEEDSLAAHMMKLKKDAEKERNAEVYQKSSFERLMEHLTAAEVLHKGGGSTEAKGKSELEPKVDEKQGRNRRKGKKVADDGGSKGGKASKLEKSVECGIEEKVLKIDKGLDKKEKEVKRDAVDQGEKRELKLKISKSGKTVTEIHLNKAGASTEGNNNSKSDGAKGKGKEVLNPKGDRVGDNVGVMKTTGDSMHEGIEKEIKRKGSRARKSKSKKGMNSKPHTGEESDEIKPRNDGVLGGKSAKEVKILGRDDVGEMKSKNIGVLGGESSKVEAKPKDYEVAGNEMLEITYAVEGMKDDDMNLPMLKSSLGHGEVVKKPRTNKKKKPKQVPAVVSQNKESEKDGEASNPIEKHDISPISDKGETNKQILIGDNSSERKVKPSDKGNGDRRAEVPTRSRKKLSGEKGNKKNLKSRRNGDHKKTLSDDDDERAEVTDQPQVKNWNLRPRKANTKDEKSDMNLGESSEGGAGCKSVKHNNQNDGSKNVKVKYNKEKGFMIKKRMKRGKKEPEKNQKTGPKFSFALKPEEIQEDLKKLGIISADGAPAAAPPNINYPSRSNKFRRRIDALVPGLGLESVTKETYEVKEKVEKPLFGNRRRRAI